MGRAGGSGGGGFSGGGRSGGFSGGGRSGGFSGSGRAGRTSRPSGGYHPPGGMPMGGPRIRVGPIFYGGGGYYGGGRRGRSGCSAPIVLLLVALIVLFFVVGASTGSGITKSTVEREKLTGVSIEETGYYEDELGWIFQGRELESGMKEFYEKTGVHPYLYLTGTVPGISSPSPSDLGDYAEQLYQEKFDDTGHFLLLFYERNERYSWGYYIGASAMTVIDDEALEIINGYINKYYYDSSLDDDEMFSRVFSDSANRMMTVTRSYWPIFFAVVVGFLILLLLFHWWKKHKEQKNKEAEQTERILNTPLETFGDAAAEETARKYQTKEEREE